VEPSVVGDTETRDSFIGARAVVVIGGDGTAHHAAPLIAGAGVPMVIAPMGTENLLAKEFGMRAEVGRILRALRDGEVSHIDMPTVNGVPFLVMCSVGLDAAVVNRVARNRNGRIRKSTYLGPILLQALRPTLPALRVTVDGETVCDGRRGMLVIANCRRYAVGLDPAGGASMTDGLLDVAFFPMRDSIAGVRWALRCRLGRQATARGFIGARGRVIGVVNAGDGEAPVQVDGEPAPERVSLPLSFVADAGKLPVLLSTPGRAG
jgi:diacylglycerol kinase (ATP)